MLHTVLALLAPSLAGQQAQPPRPASIAGQVVNEATGEPVRKAQVVLIRTERSGSNFTPLSAESDAGGNFRVENIAAGTYRLSATRTGFVGPGRGTAVGASKPVTVTAGQDVRGVVVKLTPAGIITGRVLDEEGDPVESVSIQLLRPQYINGRRQLAPSRGGVTNDLGEYRLSGIEPGRYLLSATKRGMQNAVIGGDARAAAGERPPEYQYAPLYYPAALDQASASQIQVNGGAELRGIDFRLQKARVFRVRGKVHGMVAMDGPRGGASGVAFLEPAINGGFAERRPTPVMADGTFEARDVRPGSYVLVAQQGNREMQLSARVPVQVGEADVSGVEVFLQPSVKIAGRILFEGETKPDFARFNVHFQPVDGTPPMGGVGRVDPEQGTFETNPMEPNRYRVMVQPMPAGFYLKSIRWGDQEAIDTGVLVSPGAVGEVKVLLAPGAGTISGSVRDGRDQPVPGAIVTLVPDSRYAGWWDLYRYVTASDSGQFTLPGIRPGTYKIHAWEQLENGAHQDPVFMRPFDSSGLSVTVPNNGAETVQLGVIPVAAIHGRQ